MSDSSDLLMTEVAGEIEQTVEAAVGLVIDRFGDAVLRVRRSPGRDRLLPVSRTDQVLDALEQTSHVIPFVAGRVARRTSLVGMRLGMSLLRAVRGAVISAR